MRRPKEPALGFGQLPRKPLPRGPIAPAPAPGLAFTPFVTPTQPPPGTYDPNLDAQERASGRGLEDFLADSRTSATRSDDDYLLATGEVGRRRTEGLGDIMRNYMIQGQRHEAAMRAQGVTEGSTGKASAGARQSNQDRESTRLNQSMDRSLGALALNYQRSTGDRANQVSRAQREAGFFSQDVGAARFYQAAQSGFSPEVAPDNERQGPQGAYQERIIGGRRVYVTPQGQVFSKVPGSAGASQLTPRWGSQAGGAPTWLLPDSQVDLAQESPSSAARRRVREGRLGISDRMRRRR